VVVVVLILVLVWILVFVVDVDGGGNDDDAGEETVFVLEELASDRISDLLILWNILYPLSWWGKYDE